MFLRGWFGGKSNTNKQRSQSPRVRRFRPGVGVLEDRTVPSGFGFFGGFGGSSSPATHLQVVEPANVQAGVSFDVTVKAETATNQIASSYTDTIHFSLSTTDSGATLPADYTFTARDHGVHTFHVTLSVTGAQTIAATDTTTASITGSASNTVNPAPVATQIIVRMPSNVTPGIPTYVEVVALDASGHRVPNYTGTVSFSSTDGSATLPPSYTFTGSDQGKHIFQVTFGTSGPQTLTVTDGTLTGTASPTVITVGAVTHFGVLSLPALSGFPSPVLVVALDANNNIVANYTGTVHFTSSDSAATLPADFTFTAADHGEHLFSVTFATAGKQSVTATDTVTASITGSTNVRVLSQLGFGDFWHRH
jgi:hypothetical protein